MAGTWRIVLGVAAASILTASSADAFHGRFGMTRTPPTESYYYVGPYGYCPAGPLVIPVPDARPGMIYAQPAPAPPSPTGEPPLQKKPVMPPTTKSDDPRMPVIVTSHALGNLIAGKTPLAAGRVRVGFWNLSGRDVTLRIDGKSWQLAKDRAVTLDLERQFVWQVEGRAQHVERVPEGQGTHEVVIGE